jgi:hypothetical protein
MIKVYHFCAETSVSQYPITASMRLIFQVEVRKRTRFGDNRNEVGVRNILTSPLSMSIFGEGFERFLPV